ncbi:MAG: hypothetical protein AAF192_07430, partial [Pseudomonadota bacterium]
TVAAELGLGRSHLNQRLALPVNGRADALAKLQAAARGETPEGGAARRAAEMPPHATPPRTTPPHGDHAPMAGAARAAPHAPMAGAAGAAPHATGAGDAFAAAYLDARLADLPPAAALRRALDAAARHRTAP